MIHYFYCMPRMIPYAHEALHQIGAEIRYAVQLPQLRSAGFRAASGRN